MARGKLRLNRDSDHVFSLFSKIFGAVVFSTLIFQIVRSGDKSETWDKMIFATAIIIGALSYFSLYVIKVKNFNFDLITYAAAIVGIILGIGGIEQHDPINGVVLSNRLWLGFGPFVLILLVLLSLFSWRVWQWVNLGKVHKLGLAGIASIAASFSVLSFWQDSKSIIDPDHSEYVLNEVMAIRAGNWPFENFIPQYQTVYSFVASLIPTSDTNEVSQVILVMMFIACLIALSVGIILVRQSLPSRALVPAILLVIPFTSVTQFPIREGFMGSIASLLSGLSIRILPGVLLFALALWFITSNRINRKNQIPYFAVLGVVSGWTIWSSQDFGIAATVTLFVILSVVPLKPELSKTKVLSALTVGFVPGFLTFQVTSALAGHKIDYDYFAFFARQFGSGFGSENMRTPGPLLVILPLIIALAVSHLYIMRLSMSSNSDISEKLYSNSILGLLFASWSTLGFSYYLNRSYASGQMQILFLPISISLGALIGSILYLKSKESESLQINRVNVLQSFKLKHTTVFTLISALPLSTLLLLPNPNTELDRINVGANSPRWPKQTILASIQDAKAGMDFASRNQVTLGFFGASSNYVSDATGITSVSILNSPFDLYMSQDTVTTACKYLEEVRPDYLVLSDEGAALFQFENKTLCGTYQFFDIDGVRSGRAAKRI